jgi:hypothetical protein
MKKILGMAIRREYDTDADTSTLGKYTDSLEPWNILRRESEFIAKLPEDMEMPEKGREYRAFKPYAGGEPEGSDEYIEYGMRDYERSESLNNGNWCFIGIYAEAHVQIASDCVQTIRSGGLWGIESDSGKTYLAEIEGEQFEELKKELVSIGFKETAIETAWTEREEIEK